MNSHSPLIARTSIERGFLEKLGAVSREADGLARVTCSTPNGRQTRPSRVRLASFPSFDRFTLSNALGVEGVAYFDALAVAESHFESFGDAPESNA